MGYESLFTPFKIGNMEVKNRIGLSPMGTNSAFTNGRKDAQEIDYFIERRNRYPLYGMSNVKRADRTRFYGRLS